MNGRRLFLAAFVIYCANITYWEIKRCKDMPWPPRFVGAGITFGLLDLFGSFVNDEFASVIAVGLVIAGLVNGHKVDCQAERKCGTTAQPASLSLLTTGNTGETLA